MKYKKIIWLLIILLIPLVVADNVGVIISFPDGSVHGQCVDVNNGINGYDLLQELSLNKLWAGPGSFGHQLCQINGVGDDINGDGCSYNGKYWGFFTSEGNGWQYMPVGLDGGEECWDGDLSSYDGHYCANDGDLVGFRYGEYGVLPVDYSFEQVCNFLKLNDVKVYVDGKKENGVDEEGGKIKTQPDSKVTFKIEVENDYLFNEELEVENIEASVIIKNIDDGDDIEEEIELNDLRINEDDRDEIEFTIPLFVKDGEYNLELKIVSETSDNIEQEMVVKYDLKVDKERHDVFISDLRLEHQESCFNENNKLFIEVTNLGRNDEEDIILIARNNDLGLDFSDMFDLDEGDERKNVVYQKEINFLIPKMAEVGEHTIDVNLNYQKQDDESIILHVKNCLKETPLINLETKTTNVQLKSKEEFIIPEPQIKIAVPTNQVYYEKSFLDKNVVTILLGIFLLALIVFIILIVVMLGK